MNAIPATARPSMLNKVPQVTLYFWVIKMMATTVGETAADFLNTSLGLGLSRTSLAMAVLLGTAMVLQLRARRYVPSVYWVTVVLVSVAGTLITDNLTDNLRVPLPVTTAVFAVALGVVFAAWFAVEKTLSIHTIYSRRRELFYWAAILLTFALGTAAGDLLAESLKLGYFHSALVFGAAIAVVALSHYLFKLGAVLAFWLAYILTRPFGASFGDLLAQPAASGGLGWGNVATSAGFLLVIAVLVMLMTRALPADS